MQSALVHHAYTHPFQPKEIVATRYDILCELSESNRARGVLIHSALDILRAFNQHLAQTNYCARYSRYMGSQSRNMQQRLWCATGWTCLGVHQTSGSSMCQATSYVIIYECVNPVKNIMLNHVCMGLQSRKLSE